MTTYSGPLMLMTPYPVIRHSSTSQHTASGHSLRAPGTWVLSRIFWTRFLTVMYPHPRFCVRTTAAVDHRTRTRNPRGIAHTIHLSPVLSNVYRTELPPGCYGGSRTGFVEVCPEPSAWRKPARVCGERSPRLARSTVDGARSTRSHDRLAGLRGRTGSVGLYKFAQKSAAPCSTYNSSSCVALFYSDLKFSGANPSPRTSQDTLVLNLPPRRALRPLANPKLRSRQRTQLQSRPLPQPRNPAKMNIRTPGPRRRLPSYLLISLAPAPQT
ncbi:hypothetical protein OH77DRAFT_339167 [Trametes cingulata]|nr:hypothetical protein OH77DRAFT_339167 [Trametes cingulata]